MSEDATMKSDLRIGPADRISLPMVTLATLLAAVAIGYAAWSDQHGQVTRNAADINQIKKEQQATREILIRIDENVKQLKKQIP